MRNGGAPHQYTWTFEICPHSVVVDLTVIRELQHDLSGTAEPRQGLLYGRAQPGSTHVDGHAPLPALETTEFRNAIESTRRRVVGYYRIREGRAFILTSDEIRLAKDLQQPGSIVLLIERRATGPAEGAFCFWRGDSFVTNLPLPFPIDPLLLGGDEAPSPPQPRSRPAPSQPLAGRIALMAVGMVAGAALGAALLRTPHDASNRPAATDARLPSAAITIPPPPREQLEIFWNPQGPAISTAKAGLLTIEDGGVKRQISLDPVQLGFGSVLYSPATDRIDVGLTTLQKDGRTEQALATARPFVPLASAAELGASAPRLLKEPPPPGKDVSAEPIPAPKATPLKRFTLAKADSGSPVSTMVIDPPALPLRPAAGATIPLAATLPVIAPAPPRAAQHSGRIIWTGTLLRRGVVEFDGRAVSVGSLSGGLPGVPVNLTILPAEFSDRGLMVYTSDPTRQNHTEPPSAGNGWNQINYVWDPERSRQVAVLEAPNPSNRFNRLAVRNDARRCSMMLIEWVTK